MNKLRIFIAILLTVVTLTHSKPSQAAVGAVVSTPVLIAGLAIAGTGVIGTAIYAAKCSPGEYQGLCQLIFIMVGVPVIALGLVVLDGEQEVGFREISDSEAKELGITSEELRSFNDEIDQANMLINEVRSELSQIKDATAEDSRAAWNELKDLVSPATYAAMQKIASQN